VQNVTPAEDDAIKGETQGSVSGFVQAKTKGWKTPKKMKERIVELCSSLLSKGKVSSGLIMDIVLFMITAERRKEHFILILLSCYALLGIDDTSQ
jgi:hypothetical protein